MKYIKDLEEEFDVKFAQDVSKPIVEENEEEKEEGERENDDN